MRSITNLQTILSAKAATGAGTAMNVESFQHILLEMAGYDTAAFTWKVQGSLSDTMPDFGAAVSQTNAWDYVQIKDLQNNSSIDGDTGVAYAANDVRLFEVNTNGLKWLNVVVTSYTSGKLNAKGKGFNDC